DRAARRRQDHRPGDAFAAAGHHTHARGPGMSTLKILFQIGLRNLFSSWINILIGLGMLVGSMVVTCGSSMLDSLGEAMSRSVIGSVAGHIQIYSSKSKDELAIFGAMGADPDLEPIDDFA